MGRFGCKYRNARLGAISAPHPLGSDVDVQTSQTFTGRYDYK